MSAPAIPRSLRRENVARAAGRCEYCLLHENEAILPHQPDHIIAARHGGQTTLENLALACGDCNLQKGPNLASMDWDSGQIAVLFHPRRDTWHNHFRLDGARIIGITATGRATAFLLQFNTPSRVRFRTLLQQVGSYPG